MGRTLIATIAGSIVAIGVAYLRHLGGEAGAAGPSPALFGAAAVSPPAQTPSAAGNRSPQVGPSATVKQTTYKRVLYSGSSRPGDAGGYTGVFATGSEWSISYTYDCTNTGRAGEFMLFEQGGPRNGAMPVMIVGRRGSAVYFEHGDAGRHYLAIESLCSWTIRVADSG